MRKLFFSLPLSSDFNTIGVIDTVCVMVFESFSVCIDFSLNLNRLLCVFFFAIICIFASSIRFFL